MGSWGVKAGRVASGQVCAARVLGFRIGLMSGFHSLADNAEAEAERVRIPVKGGGSPLGAAALVVKEVDESDAVAGHRVQVIDDAVERAVTQPDAVPARRGGGAVRVWRRVRQQRFLSSAAGGVSRAAPLRACGPSRGPE